jgi:hypothetical protein
MTFVPADAGRTVRKMRVLRINKVGVCLAFFLLISAPVLWSTPQEYSEDDSPGPLSTSHSKSVGITSCMKCHNEDFEVPHTLCLACHQEIAQRAAEERGYHRDKGEECSMCHTEHEGEDTVLIMLDQEDFDHEETGAVLEGPHALIKDCRACHRKDNTFPRTESISFLFIKTGCPACHTSPHPGRQDLCLKCHTQISWRVDHWKRRGPQ